MGHTYVELLYHTVFSTKHRRALLGVEMMPELARIIGGIIRKRDGKLLAMNGTDNHVHMLSFFHPKRAVSDLVRDVKAISSNWIHERFADRRDFAWQSGFAAFTVSKSNANVVQVYVENQAEHHRAQTFEEELIALLERHGIEYDKRYVFD